MELGFHPALCYNDAHMVHVSCCRGGRILYPVLE